ncbi:MAG: ATP-grasp domain-containing protein [Oceanicaulis sp.]
MTAQKTICVIGTDDYNMDLIRAIPEAKDWALVQVLEKDDVQPSHGRVDFDKLYDRARRDIDALESGPDAIIGDLDFPVTALVSLLQKHYELPGATPEAVAKCEHKYWMRQEQRKVLKDLTPPVRAINPFDIDAAYKSAPKYPFWMKPVKGHSSVLGFMIEDDDDFDRALHECRRKIHLIGEPFNQFLDHLDDDTKPRDIDGNYAVAEGLIDAKRQFTLEGYVYNGETVIYGAVDSVRFGEAKSSFSRFQYPAELPDEVMERCQDITATMMKQIGYDGAPFNIEFFWNPDTGALNLLEINARISKSHAPQFFMVDGRSHHKVAIDLALGNKPDFPKGEGKDRIAAKFILRSFEADAIVKRVPNEDEIAQLKRILPDVEAKVLVTEDLQLSTLFYQDSYSYELVDVYLGGRDAEMLEDSYRRCVDSLPVWLKPIPDTL